MIEIKAPDGSVVHFPDGTDGSVIEKAMQAQFPPTGADTLTDVAMGGAVGAAKGTLGLAGMIPDVAGLARVGANKLFDQFMPARPANAPKPPDLGEYLGSAGLQKGVEKLTGKFYEPKTTAGQYAKTIGEFLPGAAIMPGSIPANLAMAATSGVGAETAGQLTKGTGAEPYARLAGALVGGAAPSMLKRIATPLPIDQKRMEMIKLLEKEGIPLTAGQKTGNSAVQYGESILGTAPFSGGKAAAIQDAQAKAFTQGGLKRAGIIAEDAGPATLNKTYAEFGPRFENAAARSNFTLDKQFAKELLPTFERYVKNSIPDQRPSLPDSLARSITDISKNQGGSMTGAQFSSMRRDIQDALKTATGDYRELLVSLRSSLDNNLMRTGSPGMVNEWKTLNKDYSNFKTIEKAMGGAGSGTAFGTLSPQQLRTAVQNSYSGAYTRGTSDMADYARAGAAIMQPLPNSGTAQRNLITGIVDKTTNAAPVIGGVAAFSAGRSPEEILAAVLAAGAIPGTAGRAIMSKPVQKYLANQKFAGPDKDKIERLLMAIRPELMNVSGNRGQK